MTCRSVASFMFCITFLLAGLTSTSSWCQDDTVSADAVMEMVKLPGAAANLCLGGNGRYILFHMADLRKIAVFDVKNLKISGYIPAAEDDVLFAAGATKAVLVSGNQGVISRWNLQTLKRELTQSLSVQGKVTAVLMGWNTEGPAIIAGGNERHTVKVWEADLSSLKQTEIQFDGRPDRGMNQNARISANGDTIGMWEDHVSPSGLQSYFRVGGKWKARYEHESVGSIVPTSDGRHLLTLGGTYTKELQSVGPVTRNFGGKLLVPAVNGPLVLSIPMADAMRGNPNTLQGVSSELLMVGDSRALASDLPIKKIVRSEGQIPFDKRVLFFPDEKKIIQIRATADELIVFPYDVKDALKKSEAKFLIVSSYPPEQISAGDMFDYQIEYQSNAKKVTFKLEAGPDEMKVSPSGKVTWKSTKGSMPDNNVIISVSTDDGQETYHTFKLNVIGASGKDAPSVASSGGSSPSAPPVDATKMEEDQKQIKLPSRLGEFVMGGAGRYIALHMPELKKIAILDVSAAKITGYVPASDDQTLMAATKDKLLVVNVTQGVISRYNLADLKKEVTVNSPFAGPVQSIAAGAAMEKGAAVITWSQGTDQLATVSYSFISIDSLKEIAVTWESGQQPHSSFRDNVRVRAASNGKYFALHQGAVLLDGNKVTGNLSFHGANLVPSADGKFYAGNGQIFNFQKTQVSDANTNLGLIVPSITGNYFLAFPVSMHEPSKLGAKLYMFGDKRPLLTLPELTLDSGNRFDPYGHMNTARFAFIPDAKVIVKFATTNDALTLIKFDVTEALEKSGIDYLIVTSRPPSSVKPGENFEYTLDVKSKLGGVTCKLESGPDGMQVTPAGKVTWKVPKSSDPTNNVIISVGDSSGQEVYHTFNLDVDAPKDKVAEQRPEPARSNRRNNAAPRVATPSPTPEPARVADKSAGDAMKFPTRTWTDSTGNHKIQAAFSKIIDRKLVLLTYADGTEKKIPLDRLSPEDIYYAVESDIKRNSASKSSISTMSDNPFDEPNTSDGDANSLKEQLDRVADLDKRIDELAAIVKEESQEAYMVKVFHPSVLAKMQARTPPLDKQLLAEKLTNIIPEKHQVLGDSIFYPDAKITLMKQDGQWLLGSVED